jgi:type VI secretion system protein
MYKERTLLERLAKPKTAAVRTLGQSSAELLRSVLRNLQNILNTRVGHAPAQMDLGMPAPSDIVHATPDAVSLVLKNLRECIEKYEPRLLSVEISHVESEVDVLTLRFQVTARIRDAKDGGALSFETVVDPRGQFRLFG